MSKIYWLGNILDECKAKLPICILDMFSQRSDDRTSRPLWIGQ